MIELSFGKQEEAHELAAYLSRTVELYGQEGKDKSAAEFFLELIYAFYEER